VEEEGGGRGGEERRGERGDLIVANEEKGDGGRREKEEGGGRRRGEGEGRREKGKEEGGDSGKILTRGNRIEEVLMQGFPFPFLTCDQQAVINYTFLMGQTMDTEFSSCSADCIASLCWFAANHLRDYEYFFCSLFDM
jgi:hypothetical protein